MGNSNVCNRCGKQRILVKTWTEDIVTANGTSSLTYTQYACPDDECQKIVDGEIEAKRVATKERERMAEEREQARIESRSRALKNSRVKKVQS